MVFKRLIKELSIQFLEAWNDRDFEILTTLLARDIVYESPNVSLINPTNTENRLIGKELTIKHLKQVSSIFPDFKFNNDFTEICKDDRTIIMKGIMQHNNKMLVANYWLNEYGKFSYICISYPEGF